jgi:hypothetical protein
MPVASSAPVFDSEPLFSTVRVPLAFDDVDDIVADEAPAVVPDA